MQDKVFEAAQWGFTWEEACNGAGVPQGTVSLASDGLILDIPFGLLLGEGFSRFDLDKPKPVELEWIYGFSRKGDYLALSKAVIRHMTLSIPGGNSQRVGGDILLAGKAPFDPDGKVRSMTVSMTGLKEWIGESPFIVKFDTNPFAFKALEYDHDNEASYNRELYSCDDLTLSVYHEFTASPLTVDGMTITHNCRLKFDFATACTIDDAVEYARSFSQFLSLCLGFHAEIGAISLFFGESENPVRLYGKFIKGAAPTKNAIYEMPISFKSIELDVAMVIGAWLNAENELDIACRMAASLATGGWDMPIDLKFLAASQALEALSRVNAELESLPHEVYQNYCDNVLGGITDSETKSWIRGRMPQNAKGQARLLKELLERHPDFSDWLTPNRKAFINAHVAARNNYTHRSKSRGGDDVILMGEDLYWHTEAVIVLCQGIIWSNLGIDCMRFAKLLDKSRYKSYAIERARELYSIEDDG